MRVPIYAFGAYELKKSAFTLSEVMLVLSVIGVIAALTIPGMVQNLNDKQSKTLLRKDFSIISQAVNQVIYDQAGGSIKGFCFAAADFTDCLADNFAQYLKVTKICYENISTNCWHGSSYDNKMKWYSGSTAHLDQIYSHTSMILDNGTLLSFGGGHHSSSCDSFSTPYAYINTYQCCDMILIDVNGFKGPDQIGKDMFFLSLTPDGIKAPDNTPCSGVGFGCTTVSLSY